MKWLPRLLAAAVVACADPPLDDRLDRRRRHIHAFPCARRREPLGTCSCQAEEKVART